MKRFKAFIASIRRSRKKQIILLIVLLAIGGAVAFALTRDKADDPSAPEEKFYSKLTGEEVSKELSEKPILGVMIENSEEARPQSGLDAAGIVFETVTEGGITRYLALYQDDVPKDVGPVRSLRPFFASQVLGFDASVAHAGGSAEALQIVEENNVKTLTEFTHPESYRRVNDRVAPHNLYANPEDLFSLHEELEYENSEFELFERSDDQPRQKTDEQGAQEDKQSSQEPQDPEANKIRIDFSSPSFAVEFRYDPESNSYTRYLAGEPHIDALTKEPITVKNVIVLKYSGGINALGEGEAWLFKDGKVREIKWEKDSLTNRLELIGTPENSVTLNRGDSWFAALPNDRTVTY